MRIITRPILRWPGQLLDESERRNTPFRAKWADTRQKLEDEATHLGAPEIVIQMALTEEEIRLDGWPRAGAKPAHPGIIVSLDTRQGPLSFPCDTFTSQWYGEEGWHANARAIALGMESLRKLERYGITGHGEQYVGWKQLGTGGPIATGSGEEPMDAEQAARILLDAAGLSIQTDTLIGVLEGGETFRSVARKAMAATHPDHHGGDDQAFKLVERARRTLEAAPG